MDTTVITCTECSKRFKGKASLAGKKIKCPFCQAAFVVAKETSVKAAAGGPRPGPAPAPAPEEKKKIVFEDEDEPGAYGVHTLDIAPRCPNCANLMADEKAFICLFCGYNTLTRTWGKTEKLIEHSAGDYAMHQLPAYITAGFLFFHLLDILFLCLVFPFLIDQTSFMAAFDAESVRLWYTTGSLSIFFSGGFFLYKRLIVDPTPPEKKKEDVKK